MIVGLSFETMNTIAKDKHEALASVAASVFLQRGIEEATIKEIATRLGVGEATIYRHYKTKTRLAILAANYLQQEIMASYFNDIVVGTGICGLRAFYNVFVSVYENNPEYYRFLDQFDVFVASSESNEKFAYEEGLDRFKDIYLSLYKKGLEDGTVNEIEDIESFYFATTHATLSLCKKLASQSVIAQDLVIDKAKELKVFVETVLYRLERR